MKWIWQTITSLKLTVTCLSFSMLIVFVGTLAQVDQGLYLVQDRYFKSLFVFWGPEGSSWQIPVMPGGYPAMMLLSLAPPLFFRVVDPLIDDLEARTAAGSSTGAATPAG